MLQYDSDKNSWSGLLVDLKNARKGIVDVGVEADNFFKKVSSDNKNLNFLNTIDDDGFKNFIKQNNLADESLVAFLKDTNYAQKDLANYQLYLKDTGKATTTFATLTKKAGNVVKSFTATLVSMGVSWLAGQALGLIIKGFSNLIHAEEIAAEKAKEVADASRETARAHSEERDQLNSLIERYEELAQSEDFDSQTRVEIKQIQEDIVGLVGDEAKGIDLVNGNLDEQIAKLREINAIKAGETVSDYEKAYKDAADETKKATKHQGNWADNLSNSWLGNDNVITFDFFGDDKARNEGLKIIDKVWKEKGLGSAYVDEVQMDLLGLVWDSFSKLELNKDLNDTEKAEAIQAAVEALENAEGYDYNDSELWRKLVEIRNSMTGQDGTVTKQKNAANDLLDAILVQTVNSGKDVGSAEEYQKYIDEVVKVVSENETVKEAIENGDLKLEDVNAIVTDYLGNMKKYSDYTKDAIVENHDKMTVSLSELEGASDKIKTLGSAFKELSDDGYITTKTLGEIQTATGLSGDEWAEYESKLLNAKKGSAEFSQIMADLTYKMLDQTFANKDLNSLTEQQISAILRENGVVNADAVAHDWLTKAKETLRIKTALAKASTAEEVVALATEASQAGITGNALNDLIMDMGIFNNTNLDVSQKVAALQEMGYYAHWTAQGLANIDKVKKYSFDGKDYIASYDKDGKLVGIEQETQVEIPNVEIPKITIPNYSGATSGGKSSSDKDKPDYEDPTDAIIDRINLRHRELEQQEEYIENAIEIAELENDYKKQISLTNDKLDVQRQKVDALKTANDELHQMAEDLRNSTPDWNEEEWFDSQGNATKAYIDFINDRIKAGADKEEIEAIKDQFEKISKIKEAWVENDEERLSLTKEILQTEEDIVNLDYGHSQDWIDERNTYNDWALFNDSEIDAWERVIKRLKEDYDGIAGATEKIKEAEENLFEARKEQFSKTTDFASSYWDSQKTLLQSHYDVTNSIAEAQHEINKELEASMTMYAYLDEETRKLLFNQEDYNKLSQELNEIQDKSLKLKADYEQALDGATLNTVEEITSNYEMQYETLMKSYEIAKAELEVAKKRQQLDNVLAEKNVRMLINGQWEWVAKTQDVINAQSELADAEWARKTAEAGLKQTESINDLTAKQNKLGTTISLFEDGVIDLDTAVEKVKQMFEELPSAIQNSISMLSGQSSGSSYSSGTVSKGGSGYYNKDPNFDYTNAIANAGSEEEVRQLNEERSHKIWQEGLSYNVMTDDEALDHWKSKRGYASGVKHALPGVADVNEGNRLEGLITNDGTLIPMANFEGGETVFNHEMVENLWHQAQIPWNIYTPNIPDFVTKQSSIVDQSVTFTGDITVNNPVDLDGFVNELTTRAKSHNAITKKMS